MHNSTSVWRDFAEQTSLSHMKISAILQIVAEKREERSEQNNQEIECLCTLAKVCILGPFQFVSSYPLKPRIRTVFASSDSALQIRKDASPYTQITNLVVTACLTAINCTTHAHARTK